MRTIVVVSDLGKTELARRAASTSRPPLKNRNRVNTAATPAAKPRKGESTTHVVSFGSPKKQAPAIRR